MPFKAPPFTPQIRAEIVRKVQELTDNKCPMGHNANWLVVEGYSRTQLSHNSEEISLSGSGIPSAILVCVQCGFVAQFALGILELLTEETK
jgi:hypothetical protein